MPFGPWQTKSLIVGVILGGVVVPRVLAMVANRSK